MTAAILQNDSKSYEWILLKFLLNVDNGPRNRRLKFGDLPDSGGTLISDLSKIKSQDHKATHYVM